MYFRPPDRGVRVQLRGVHSISQQIPSVPPANPAVRPRIVLVGAGHVFDIREAVKTVIRRERPRTVALELDSARFQALLSKERGNGEGMPIVYRLLAKFQSDIAQQYGSEAGSEMIAAAEAAGEVGARIELIDMDALNVFKRMFNSMSFKEKLLLAIGTVFSLFASRKTVEKEIERFSSDEDKVMAEIKASYPSLVRVLIDERNEHMAKKLKDVSSTAGGIVAVVGDGHVPGMSALLSGFADVEVVRLGQLREMPSDGHNAQVTMSFVLNPHDKP